MFKKIWVLFFILILNVHCNPSTIRQTQNGPIEGVEMTSSLKQKYYAFKGIAYAEPPITGTDPYTGKQVDRRFKATEPLKRNWNDILKVDSFGKPCIPSTYEDITKHSEDCLFLNVYVPADGSQRKTVMVYIHGGSFTYGNADDKRYGPDLLLSQDNIVVTIQYRLGIFGFMNLGHGEYTGNMGLKDQQMALKWIYENIEEFSGQKNEILLLGHSAGGVSSHYHALNDESRKYFNRIFALSGSAFSAYAMRKANHVQLIQECSQIDDMDKIIEHLKTAKASTLSACYPWIYPAGLNPKWVPTIESPNTKGRFFSKTPDEIYSSGEALPMDSMFSFTSQEILSFFSDLINSTQPLIQQNEIDPIVTLPFEDATISTHSTEFKQTVEKLRAAYFPDSANISAIRRGNIDLMSDLSFNDSILKATVLQTIVNNNGTDKSRHKNTYLFRFSVNTELKFIKFVSPTTHGDDLPYMFQVHEDKTYHKHLERKTEIYDLIMRSVKMITNFARTGDPSIEGDTPFKSCTSSNEIFCQEVSNEPKTRVMNDIKEQLHYDLWREIEKVALQLGDTTDNNTNRLCQGTIFIFILFHLFVFVFINSRLLFCE